MSINLGLNKIKDIYLGSQKIKEAYLGNTLVYTSNKSFLGLKLTSDEDNSSVGYQITGSITKDIYYSENGSVWTSWDGTPVTLNKGEHIFVWNKLNTLSTSSNDYFQFVMTGKIKASGNADSMINFSNIKNYCYSHMFQNCSSLIEAPELPSMTIAKGCYEFMFYGCSALTEAPNLPATISATTCYRYMFTQCGSLTKAPEVIPFTTAAAISCAGMFHSCTSLTKAPELPATTISDSCYYQMFFDCSSLTQAPELPAEVFNSGSDRCYMQMFYGCSSLTKAPYIKVKTVNTKARQLDQMFYNCSNLNEIKIGPINNFGTSNTISYHWVQSVSPTGTFYYNGSDTTRGISAIPTGWMIERF